MQIRTTNCSKYKTFSNLNRYLQMVISSLCKNLTQDLQPASFHSKVLNKKYDKSCLQIQIHTRNSKKY